MHMIVARACQVKWMHATVQSIPSSSYSADKQGSELRRHCMNRRTEYEESYVRGGGFGCFGVYYAAVACRCTLTTIVR